MNIAIATNNMVDKLKGVYLVLAFNIKRMVCC